jgi:hypothetical protein
LYECFDPKEAAIRRLSNGCGTKEDLDMIYGSIVDIV